MQDVVQQTAETFARVLVMPNTLPPIVTAEGLADYRRAITDDLAPGQSLDLLMTFKLLPSISPETIGELRTEGAIGGKLYPVGVTTNAEDGVSDVRALEPQLAAMEEHGLVLEIHGEVPGEYVLDREEAFLPELEWVVNRFPRLRVVLEHVTSAAAVRFLAGMPQTVAATITAHHLMITLDDVIGGDLRPHHFCKPVAKAPADRDALREAAFGGSGRFFFGSDSAPHLVTDKESACGCAGVYSAPVAIPALAELFSSHGIPLCDADRASEDRTSLEQFVSFDGAAFYHLSRNPDTITLAEDEWIVPDRYGAVVPFLAGERLRYQVRKDGTR